MRFIVCFKEYQHPYSDVYWKFECESDEVLRTVIDLCAPGKKLMRPAEALDMPDEVGKREVYSEQDHDDLVKMVAEKLNMTWKRIEVRKIEDLETMYIYELD